MRIIAEWLRNIELRRMVTSVVFLLLFLFAATQSILLWAMMGTVRASRMEALRGWAAQLEALTDSVIDTISSNANTLAYGITAGKFINARTQKEKISAFNQLGMTMDAVTVANPNIGNIFMTDFDLIFVGNIEGEVLEMRKEIQKHFESAGWPASQTYLSIEYDGHNTLLCVTPSHMRNGRQMYAVISFLLDLPILAPLNQMGEINYIFLLDDSMDVLYANVNAPDELLWELLGDMALSGRRAYEWENSGNLIAASRPASKGGWRWVCSMSAEGMESVRSSFVQFIILTDIVMLILLLLFRSVLDSGITRPLEGIIAFVDDVVENAGMKRLTVRDNNEIGQIAGQINRLLDSVEKVNREKHDAQRRLYELEITQKQTELNALYSQINPHFLYNTLDCLRSIAMVREVPEVADIAIFLSDILRYSIKGQPFVRLSDELECIREYLGIMQIRHRNRFLVTIDIEEELKSAFIPRMILQPIVENAIFHGLEQTRRDPALHIRGIRRDKDMRLEVEDNGIGMTDETVEALRREILDVRAPLATGAVRSVGLSNIAHRIRLIFGADYGMHIVSSPREGTIVALHLPVMEHEPFND